MWKTVLFHQYKGSAMSKPPYQQFVQIAFFTSAVYSLLFDQVSNVCCEW
jgi:hypothetical protein